MATICRSCGLIIGEGCFDPETCAAITADMDRQAYGRHANDQIASLTAENERLKERCEAYKGQVKAGSDQIERLRAEVRALNEMYSEVLAERNEARAALRSAAADQTSALDAAGTRSAEIQSNVHSGNKT